MTPWYSQLLFEGIYIGDKEGDDYSRAACMDIMAHEATHAVMYHDVHSIWEGNITDFINEAYADIFACLMTDDWKLGEDLRDDKTDLDCLRNIEEPYNPKTPFFKVGLDKTQWDKRVDANRSEELWYLKEKDKNLAKYLASAFISHAAYLMGKNGLSSEEIRKLWYGTIYKGAYGLSPRYSDVRKNILMSAKTLNFSADQISAIERAFDAVGITDSSSNLTGKVTELSGVKVAVYKSTASSVIPVTTSANSTEGVNNTRSGSLMSKMLQKVKTFLTEYFSMKLGKGTYTVTFSKAGYKPYTAEVSIGSENVELNVALSTGAAVSSDVPIDEAHFPDENFRKYVKRFDIDSDDVLSEAEIAEVTYITVAWVAHFITSRHRVFYLSARIKLSL